MAVALAALPQILQNLSPEQALEFIKTAEEAAAEARSITAKLIHSTSLTEKENYEGWVPLMIILYRLYQQFFAPQIAYTLEVQRGLGAALNKLGANIDTSRLDQMIAFIDRTAQPMTIARKPAATPSSQIGVYFW